MAPTPPFTDEGTGTQSGRDMVTIPGLQVEEGDSSVGPRCRVHTPSHVLPCLSLSGTGGGDGV